MFRHVITLGFISAFAAAATTALHAESIDGIGPVGDVEKLHGGFQFTEGPADDGQGNLYFTDIPTSKIYKVDANGKLSTFTDKSGHANGLMFNAKGELVACEMDGQVVAWDVEAKKRRVIADKYNGKRFNAPNDLVIDEAGGIYFTDPHFRAPDPLPQGMTCVYYIDPQGKVTRLVDDLPAPNGVLLSPDEKTLYVFPSGQADMMAYPVESPGTLGEGRVFCTLKQRKPGQNSGGDGATIDRRGNLYITSGLGLQVYDPKGKLLGIIAADEQPANVTFGGKDDQTLYITARTSLYTAKMEAQGHRFALASPTLEKVSGAVTVDGEPLPGAIIRFTPQKGRPAIGRTNARGQYELTTFEEGDGASPGEYRVSISMADRKIDEDLPPEYSDTNSSKLTAEIQPGENVMDFDLTSE